tara:strand:- start:585 stop:1316 length:732 start_codon:yes stop_codon:yes gene_type:complete
MKLIAEKVIKNLDNVIDANQIDIKLMENYDTDENFNQVSSSENKSISNITCSSLSEYQSEKINCELKSKNQNILLKLSRLKNNTDVLMRIAKATNNNKWIKHFIVRKSKITIKDAKILANILAKTKSISWLAIDQNNINNAKLTEIVTGLEKNQSISHIILSKNKFSDKSFSLFLSKIEKKHNIRSIFAQGNQISKKSNRAILNFIKKSKSIKIIDLRDNKLTIEVKKEIKKACLNKNIRCYI